VKAITLSQAQQMGLLSGGEDSVIFLTAFCFNGFALFVGVFGSARPR
jgi:hypothetical protein